MESKPSKATSVSVYSHTIHIQVVRSSHHIKHCFIIYFRCTTVDIIDNQLEYIGAYSFYFHHILIFFFHLNTNMNNVDPHVSSNTCSLWINIFLGSCVANNDCSIGDRCAKQKNSIILRKQFCLINDENTLLIPPDHKTWFSQVSRKLPAWSKWSFFNQKKFFRSWLQLFQISL